MSKGTRGRGTLWFSTRKQPQKPIPFRPPAPLPAPRPGCPTGSLPARPAWCPAQHSSRSSSLGSAPRFAGQGWAAFPPEGAGGRGAGGCFPPPQGARQVPSSCGNLFPPSLPRAGFPQRTRLHPQPPHPRICPRAAGTPTVNAERMGNTCPGSDPNASASAIWDGAGGGHDIIWGLPAAGSQTLGSLNTKGCGPPVCPHR